jgi:hypothetical protein
MSVPSRGAAALLVPRPDARKGRSLDWVFCFVHAIDRSCDYAGLTDTILKKQQSYVGQVGECMGVAKIFRTKLTSALVKIIGLFGSLTLPNLADACPW